MTDMPKPTPPNWVQQGEFVLKVVALIGICWAFVNFDWNGRNLDRRKNELEIAKAEETTFSVEGEVLYSDVSVIDKDETVPLCPVFITIKNTCQRRINIERIEYKIFTAALRDVSTFRSIDVPKAVITLASANGGGSCRLVPAHKTRIGMIDPESPKWSEVTEVTQSVTNKGSLGPNQESVERRHVFAPTELNTMLTKIEVTVFASGSKRVWYGFANQQMCRPTMPFEASAAEEVIEPAAAPRE